MTRVISYPQPQLLTVSGPTHGRREDHKRGTLWTDREVMWLVVNYPKYTARYCAHHLRRSEEAVREKAQRMELRSKSHVSLVTMKDILARFLTPPGSSYEQETRASAP